GGRRRLRRREPQERRGEGGERRVERTAARLHVVGDLGRGGGLAAREGGDQLQQVAAVDGAQHIGRVARSDLARAVCDRLGEQRQRVAHAAGRGARDQGQRFGLGGNLFLAEDVREMRDDGRRWHLLQVELQA